MPVSCSHNARAQRKWALWLFSLVVVLKERQWLRGAILFVLVFELTLSNQVDPECESLSLV